MKPQPTPAPTLSPPAPEPTAAPLVAQEVKPIEVTIEQHDKVAQGELIPEVKHSVLETVKIGIEDALFRHGVKTDSKKLGFYKS